MIDYLHVHTDTHCHLTADTLTLTIQDHTAAKDDRGSDSQNISRKASVISPLTAYQHSDFYMPDDLPVAQPT